MNDLTAFQNRQIASVFGQDPVTNSLGAGIAASFPVMGYKGKVWSIKYRGVEKQLLRSDGDGARNSIEVIIVGTSEHISKIFYLNGYVEGSNAAPDCFSNNGVAPEPNVAHRQSVTCAACPRNVWGSKISEVTGKAAKECQDNKRLAIVPLEDIMNESFGGPILLRVPAASLQELATFGNKMAQMGYPFYSFGTRISFDTEQAYPKFKFSPIRPLTEQEAALVIKLRKDPQVDRVLAEAVSDAPAQITEQPVFEQQTAQPTEQKPWTSSTGPVLSAPAQPAVQTTQVKTNGGSAPATESPTLSASEDNSIRGFATEKTNQNGGSVSTAATAQAHSNGSASPEAKSENTPLPNPDASKLEQELDALIESLA